MSLTPAPLPLAVETTCPFCQERVTVALVSASATAEVTAVRFRPEYVAHHRCPVQSDPWGPSPESDTSWAVPKPRTDEP